jgi:hypothetical protein
MARGESLWARCRVNWPNDERVWALGPVGAWVNHVLWLLAVKLRRELLPPEVDARYLASKAHVSPKAAEKALAKMAAFSDPLIRFEGGRIRVIGVAKEHRAIWAWLDRREGPASNEQAENMQQSGNDDAMNTDKSSDDLTVNGQSRAVSVTKITSHGEREKRPCLESSSSENLGSQPSVTPEKEKTPLPPEGGEQKQAGAPVPLKTTKTAQEGDGAPPEEAKDALEVPAAATGNPGGGNGQRGRTVRPEVVAAVNKLVRLGRIPNTAGLRHRFCALLRQTVGRVEDGEEQVIRALFIGSQRPGREEPAGWVFVALKGPRFSPADRDMRAAKEEMGGNGTGARAGPEAEPVTVGRVLKDMGKGGDS